MSKPAGNFATAPKSGQNGSDKDTGKAPGSGLPSSVGHPENTLYGCIAVILAIVFGLAIWGYVYWRFNPEFHIETAGPASSRPR